MNSAMVKVYANLVKKGLKSIEEVPASLREAVEAALKTKGCN